MRHVFILLLCVAAFAPKGHAEPIDSTFVKVPVTELPLLDTNSRLDMLDLYNYNMEAKADNIFGGSSVMVGKSPNHIRLRLTETSDWELMRLKADTAVIYACIHTLKYSVGESSIRFYDEAWHALPGVSLPEMVPTDFISTADSVDAERGKAIIRKFAPFSYTLKWEDESDGSRPTLVVSPSLTQLGEEDRAEAERYLTDIRLVWDGGRFLRATGM